MNKKGVNILIGFAILSIVLGIFIAFFDLERICIKIKNDGYVVGLFSLSGIILYFAALMYQIKEYKLQVIELRKSVEAQTKSSEALDEQKNILLEQNINSLIFGLIDNFNNFKVKNSTQESIYKLAKNYQDLFALNWTNNLNNKKFNKDELNVEFASGIKKILNKTISGMEEYTIFKRYIYMTYNIFHIIDESKFKVPHTYFKPYFLTQFDTNEIFMLYLSNLVDSDMPSYTKLFWGHQTTQEITDFIAKNDRYNIDKTNFDISILTNEFNKLKQQ